MSTIKAPVDQLDRMAHDLSRELADLPDDTPNDTPVADPVDRAEMRSRLEHQARNRARLEQRLREVEAARDRVADGSWGTCEVCGEQIQSGRLEALPMTATCISCAE